MKKDKVIIKRYNIYSGMKIDIDGISICVDPSKIVQSVLETMAPDIILISHESMDHLDPTQVYYLQKRKNARVYCSIAVAIDLQQYYQGDISFTDNLFVMVPGSVEVYNNIVIKAGLSIHCDYMLPLTFRIDSLKSGISILHCIDSLMSDELIKLSRDCSCAIIPIGIAKGIDERMGLEFCSKLECSVFVPNHFTNQLDLCKELFEEKNLKKNNEVQFIPLEWDEYIELQIQGKYLSTNKIKERRAVEDIIFDLKNRINVEKNIIELISIINLKKGCVYSELLIDLLLMLFITESESVKINIIVVLIMLTQYRGDVLKECMLQEIQKNLFCKPNENQELKCTMLFLLAVQAQQNGTIYWLDEFNHEFNLENEHMTYWLVEYLGRVSISKNADRLKAIDRFCELIQIETVYNSVVVRRKIFWEMLRVVKFLPNQSFRFISCIEKGLTDNNPDVRLLAILCIKHLCRIQFIEDKLLKKMSTLYCDDEDDVREMYATALRDIYAFCKMEVKKQEDNLKHLVDDENYHVRLAAKETIRRIGW